MTRIKQAKSRIKQYEVNDVIKNYQVKDNLDYSCYLFRHKAQEDQYKKTGNLPKAITSLYNENAVRFVLKHVPDKPSK